MLLFVQRIWNGRFTFQCFVGLSIFHVVQFLNAAVQSTELSLIFNWSLMRKLFKFIVATFTNIVTVALNSVLLFSVAIFVKLSFVRVFHAFSSCCDDELMTTTTTALYCAFSGETFSRFCAYLWKFYDSGSSARYSCAFQNHKIVARDRERERTKGKSEIFIVYIVKLMGSFCAKTNACTRYYTVEKVLLIYNFEFNLENWFAVRCARNGWIRSTRVEKNSEQFIRSLFGRCKCKVEKRWKKTHTRLNWWFPQSCFIALGCKSFVCKLPVVAHSLNYWL